MLTLMAKAWAAYGIDTKTSAENHRSREEGASIQWIEQRVFIHSASFSIVKYWHRVLAFPVHFSIQFILRIIRYVQRELYDVIYGEKSMRAHVIRYQDFQLMTTIDIYNNLLSKVN